MINEKNSYSRLRILVLTASSRLWSNDSKMTAGAPDEQLFVILQVLFDFVAKRAKIVKHVAPLLTEQLAYAHLFTNS